mgnify:CR=1 FL=1
MSRAQIGAAAMARFGSLQRRLAGGFEHHLFAHSAVERLGKPAGRMCRPLTEEERASREIIAEDREFFATVIEWAKVGIALADLRDGQATATQSAIVERRDAEGKTEEGEDDGVDF